MSTMNRTLALDASELGYLEAQIIHSVGVDENLRDKIICADWFEISEGLPMEFVDLVLLDPPYNLTKNYNGNMFKEKNKQEYAEWFEKIIQSIIPKLKRTATVYVCSDWRTSVAIAPVLEKFFFVRNRITWEREKGRGASRNWKNNTEDIWFCTLSEEYTFNLDAVKLRKSVIAPYRDDEGEPKDWRTDEGGAFRLTCPSNIWTDITVPFWSMPENTEHPAQKPEKLFAKLLLASSNEGDFVLDPFMGSGTSVAVCKKLGRNFFGVEIEKQYCCLAQKRLELAEGNSAIQGYSDGVFWERNSLASQNGRKKIAGTGGLFYERKPVFQE